MPVDYLIDADARVVFTVAIEEFTLADAVGHMDRLQADPHYTPTLSQIGDFRDVTRVDVSGFDVRTLAKRTLFDRDARRVLVIRKAIAYGLARMFTTLREMRGDTSLKIVRDLGEAADWVGVGRDHAEAMCERVKQRLRSEAGQ
jgi:hypothetical protein